MSFFAIVWSTSAAALTLCWLCWLCWLLWLHGREPLSRGPLLTEQLAASAMVVLRPWHWLPTSSLVLLAVFELLSSGQTQGMRAQRETVQLRHELTHTARLAMLAHLASALAHELHQQNTSAAPDPSIAR
jgi:hypothetical protein